MKRCRILIIAPFFPFPPTDGGKICIYGFVDYLRRYHEFHLFIPIRTYEEFSQLEQLKSLWSEVTFHVVDETPPRSRASRLKGLIGEKKIKTLQGLLNRFSPKSVSIPADPYRYYANLSNVFPFLPFDIKYVAKLTHVLSAYQFDIVQTELTPVLNLVHLIPTGAKKIFVQIESREDVLRDYGKNNQIHDRYAHYITQNAAFLEYHYMSLYDAVFALNEQDQNMIASHCPSVKVYVSPFALLDNQFGVAPDKGIYNRLIFLGGENHYPNYDGMKWFLTEVASLLKDQPVLLVTGNWSEATKTEFKRLYKPIEFTGFVDDVAPLFKESISIVPIRLGGGGVRTKVLYSMANYSPVISTSVALTGIAGNPEEHFLAADSPSEFAMQINQVLLNPQTIVNLVQNARDMVEATYSQHAMGERRNGYYEEILRD